MSMRVVFEKEDGIAVLIPAEDCGLSLLEIAKKDVPQGVPFLIVDVADIPQDRTFRDAWVADFSNPHGYGGEQ